MPWWLVQLGEKYILACHEQRACRSMRFPRCTLPSARWKGVESTKCPSSAPALLPRLSISIPMVMREGNACGLMIRSGLHHSSCPGFRASYQTHESEFKTLYWRC